MHARTLRTRTHTGAADESEIAREPVKAYGYAREA